MLLYRHFGVHCKPKPSGSTWNKMSVGEKKIKEGLEEALLKSLKEGDNFFYFLCLPIDYEDNSWKEHEVGGQGAKERSKSRSLTNLWLDLEQLNCTGHCKRVTENLSRGLNGTTHSNPKNHMKWCKRFVPEGTKGLQWGFSLKWWYISEVAWRPWTLRSGREERLQISSLFWEPADSMFRDKEWTHLRWSFSGVSEECKLDLKGKTQPFPWPISIPLAFGR